MKRYWFFRRTVLSTVSFLNPQMLQYVMVIISKVKVHAMAKLTPMFGVKGVQKL